MIKDRSIEYKKHFNIMKEKEATMILRRGDMISL
jgi:hypothetical protein